MSGHPEPLSARQADVLDVVVRVYRITREPVSAQLVATALHLDRSTVLEHFTALYRKRWLAADGSQAKPASLIRA